MQRSKSGHSRYKRQALGSAFGTKLWWRGGARLQWKLPNGDAMNATPEKSNAEQVHRPESILLVDDNPSNLLVMEAALETLGANLVRAESGEAALMAVLKQEFALILLDVNMSPLDGLECARMIRNRNRSKRIPII